MLREILQDQEQEQECQNEGSNVNDEAEGSEAQDLPTAGDGHLRRTPSMTSLPAATTAHLSASLTPKLAKHSSLPPAPSSGRTRSASAQIEQRRKAYSELALDSCRTLEIDYSLLSIDDEEPKRKPKRPSHTHRASINERDEEDKDEGINSKASLTSLFDWEECLNTQMLSFSLEELPALLDLTMEIKPSRAQEVRNFPANVLFLATRYASRYGGEDLLGELLLGALDRIEASINVSFPYITRTVYPCLTCRFQTNPENLANSAFWLSNSVLLLYYLRKDPQTQQNTLEYQDNLYDMIGEQGCRDTSF